MRPQTGMLIFEGDGLQKKVNQLPAATIFAFYSPVNGKMFVRRAGMRAGKSNWGGRTFAGGLAAMALICRQLADRFAIVVRRPSVAIHATV